MAQLLHMPSEALQEKGRSNSYLHGRDMERAVLRQVPRQGGLPDQELLQMPFGGERGKAIGGTFHQGGQRVLRRPFKRRACNDTRAHRAFAEVLEHPWPEGAHPQGKGAFRGGVRRMRPCRSRPAARECLCQRQLPGRMGRALFL